MRRIVVAGLALICIIALGSLAATREPRSEVNGAGTRPPTQVEVTNFPTVQGIAGTVNIGNLPAVQTISGSVGVSNLPLDSDGNLRVADTPASGHPFSFQKVADGVSLNANVFNFVGPFDVSGWRGFTIFVRATLPTTGGTLCVAPDARFGAPGLQILFASIPEISGTLCTSPNNYDFVQYPELAMRGNVVAPQLTLIFYPDFRFPTPPTVEAWLYLYH